MKLNKKEKSWVLYDVANSAFTLMLATVIPIYFKNIATSAGLKASDSTSIWGYVLVASTLIVAILAPYLGTMADYQGKKVKYFIVSLAIGLLGCVLLAFTNSWIVFLIFVLITRIGYSLSLIFYDAMLVDVTDDSKFNKMSLYGYAFGYIGSVIPFIMGFLIIQYGEQIGIPSRFIMTIVLLITVVWWAIFSLPLINNYEQIHYIDKGKNLAKDSIIRIKNLFKDKDNKPVLIFLLAFFFYIDGVYTIIEMAATFGKDIGMSDTMLLVALLTTQILAFPSTLIFIKINKYLSTKKMMFITIIGYFLISIYSYFLYEEYQFWILAIFVAFFQGGIQALSRSYFASIIPKDNAGEFFGIYDIFGKGATIFGTLFMSVITQITGDIHNGVLVLSFTFVIGIMLLMKHFKVVK